MTKGARHHKIFINEFIKYDSKYEDSAYRIEKVKISRKTKEYKTKIEFLTGKYEEKEALLKIVKTILKEKVNKANKNEGLGLIAYSLLVFVLLIVVMIVLFT